jgi:hypothetical protein
MVDNFQLIDSIGVKSQKPCQQKPLESAKNRCSNNVGLLNTNVIEILFLNHLMDYD